MEIVKLGTLYLDGCPIDSHADLYETTGIISMGEAVPGKELEFARFDNKLFGMGCACIGVTWDRLNKDGLIFGTPITIGGVEYLCRSPRGGSFKGALSEWDSLIRDLYHGKGPGPQGNDYVWCQETHKSWRNERIVRRPREPKNWDHFRADNFEASDLGFRPILERMDGPLITEIATGTMVKVYGKDDCVIGRLVSLTDYDVILNCRGYSIPDTKGVWAEDKIVAINRNWIIWTRRL